MSEGSHNRATTLPTTAKERKTYPVASGVMDYFPDAIAAVAHVSFVGNEQHNPGQPLHWAREKSTDQDDTLLRHFLERGGLDADGQRHSAKLAWRALALLQLEIEADTEKAQAPVLGPGEIHEIRKTIGDRPPLGVVLPYPCPAWSPGRRFRCELQDGHITPHQATIRAAGVVPDRATYKWYDEPAAPATPNALNAAKKGMKL